MYNEIDSGNLESTRKGKRKCVSVAIVRSKNRARKSGGKKKTYAAKVSVR